MHSELFSAAKKGDVNRVRTLIESGVDPLDRDDNSATLLHYAARNLNYAIAGLALKAGLAPDVKNSSGHTPADWASMANEMRMGCPNDSARQFISWLDIHRK
ncbi:ankyrin repeat domain-containing protein [Rubritalea halochordaticola]